VAETASRRPLQALLLVAIVAIAIVAIFLLTVPLGSSEPSADSATVGGHPLLGKPAPEINLLTLDGEQATLSSLRGQPVLVNFWATWCLPCREEFPLMVTAYEEHSDDGLEILGIVHDDTADGAKAFAADMNAEWPMLNDVDDIAWQDYTGIGMPTSFFIDEEGVVRAFSLGGFTETGLAAQLETILPRANASALSPS
jgi:cytochrome c biogenesis protein CcmG/thiol:disulfide interchange protein DsbE